LQIINSDTLQVSKYAYTYSNSNAIDMF